MGGISQLNTFIDIISTEIIKDNEGFSVQHDIILASIRAQKKIIAGGSENHKSSAEFAEELTTFCFRKIPDLTITTAMYITDDTGRYNIKKVDGISGRQMYVTVTASLIIPSKG